MAFILIIALFLVFVAYGAYLKAKKALDAIQKEYNPVKQRYQDLTGIEKDIEQREKDIQVKKQELEALDKETTDLKALSEGLQKEIDSLESNEITYGLYKPEFNFDTSAEYDKKLAEIRDQEKSLIDQGKAALSAVTWTVEGSAKKENR